MGLRGDMLLERMRVGLENESLDELGNMHAGSEQMTTSSFLRAISPGLLTFPFPPQHLHRSRQESPLPMPNLRPLKLDRNAHRHRSKDNQTQGPSAVEKRHKIMQRVNLAVARSWAWALRRHQEESSEVLGACRTLVMARLAIAAGGHQYRDPEGSTVEVS